MPQHIHEDFVTNFKCKIICLNIRYKLPVTLVGIIDNVIINFFHAMEVKKPKFGVGSLEIAGKLNLKLALSLCQILH